MTSHQLPTKSSQPVIARRFVRKACGSLLAATLLVSLGGGQLFAQGGYYPQVNVLGGSPFDPSGTPITSNPELNYINSKLLGTATLINPPPAGKTAATSAEYAAAVLAAATDVANGVPGITITSLAQCVAKYRTADINSALGAMANGVIASTVPTLAARKLLLKDLAKAAVLANPAGVGPVGQTRLIQVFEAAANDADYIQDVGDILKHALDNSSLQAPGTSVGSPAASALIAPNVNALVTDAINKIQAGAWGGAVPTAPEIVRDTIAGLALGSPTVKDSVANLDAAAQAVMSYNTGGAVTQSAMLAVIQTTTGPVTTSKKGAIAQGTLRIPGANATTVANLQSVLGGSYVTILTNSWAANAPMNGGSPAGAPAAAAGLMVKRGPLGVAPTDTAISDVLNSAPGFTAADFEATVQAAVGANQTKAVQIAKTARGNGGAPTAWVGGTVEPETAAAGAIKGARLADAGAIANAVIALPSVTTQLDWEQVGAASATAVGAAGYLDVAYNVAVAVKAKPADTFNNNRDVLLATSGVMGADNYLGTIAYVAGNNKANPGLATDPLVLAPLTPAGSAAVVAGNNLILGLSTSETLKNYQNTYTALIGSGAAETTKSLLTAASLANSSDAVGALAAASLVGGLGAVALDQLTALAVNANPSKQFSLTLGSAVASATNSPTVNIQEVVGRFIINHSTANLADIATAATVVKPQWSHFIAHTASFNAALDAKLAIAPILNHSRISIPGTLAKETGGIPDAFGAGGRPAALAAIAAGLTTGIRENRQLTAVERRTALFNTTRELLVVVHGTTAYATNPKYTDASTGAAVFRQSNGATPASFSVVKASGIAGAATGFVAQLVKAGDHAALALSSDLAAALNGAYLGAGGAGNQLTIGQAAGQAFRWISGGTYAALADDIARAMVYGVNLATGVMNPGPVPAAALTNAITFGITEAASGNPGAGAAGLREGADPYYNHHNAQGTPVSNIFTL